MKKKKLILKNIIQETEDTKTLVFTAPENEERFDFLAGQYLHLFIGEESKMYTISSAPEERYVNISIKAGKNFSLKLQNLEIGAEIEYLGPLGFLTLEELEDEQKEKDIVFISAGIGITPFYSMLQSEQQRGFNKKITLLYVNRDKDHTLFYDELEKINNENDNFKIHHFWSADDNKLDYKKIQNIVDKDNIYYICGPTQFVDDFWKELKDDGIDEDDILTESFFIQ